MKTAYCFGHISTGMLYRINGKFPSADGYGEIVSAERNYSGEALSSAVVLKRLGVQVMLEGNWLGDTEVGQGVRTFIRNEGIDDGAIVTPPGYSGVEEIVFSDDESRTVFGRYEALLFTEKQWEMPDIQKIALADVACADPSFGEASLQVLKGATSKSIPFVAIDAPYDSPLVQQAAVAILSHEFLQRTYPTMSLSSVFDEYMSQCAGLSVFTFGAQDLWYGRRVRRKMKPLVVTNVLDTAGAGDSFRAGVMFGMLYQMNDEEMLRTACKVAAEVIQTSPGVLGFKGNKLR